MSDLSSTIESAASTPAAASADGVSATARPIAEVVLADQYLAKKSALDGLNAQGGPRSLWSKLRPARVVPPKAY